MSAFSFAVSQLLIQEGGLSEDPHDEGGITNFGISFRFYKTIFPQATPDDIRILKVEDAINIYQKHFWDNTRFSEINNQLIANQAFDMHVNMGLAPAVKIIQRACCAVHNESNYLIDDGIFGDMTLHVINTTPVFDLSIAIRSERAGYYREIVARNPNKESDLKGWINRAYRV